MPVDRCELVHGNQAKRWSLDLLRRSCLFAVLTLWASIARADSTRFIWDPNPETDLAGYVLVWGSQSGVYTQSATIAPNVNTYQATYTCTPGSRMYFAIRAFNTSGLHSGYSNEVSVLCGTTTPVKLTPRSLGNVVVVIVTRG